MLHPLFLEVVRLLLARRADVYAVDNHALCWASENGHLEIVRLLLERGADVTALDNCALRWTTPKKYRMEHTPHRGAFFSFLKTSSNDVQVGLQNRCDEGVLLHVKLTKSVECFLHRNINPVSLE